MIITNYDAWIIGAALSFGQHKKGDTLFPKRKDEKGNWLENGGWHKWQKDQSGSKVVLDKGYRRGIWQSVIFHECLFIYFTFNYIRCAC